MKSNYIGYNKALERPKTSSEINTMVFEMSKRPRPEEELTTISEVSS